MSPGYFFRPPFFLPWLYPGLTWRVPVLQKEIFLTFDDGPVPGPTEFALDHLARANAKATFFCIGDNIRKHGTIFRRVVEAGHGIGNHTFHHISGWKMGEERYLDNVRLCHEEMTKANLNMTGPANLFRPPYGRITRKQIAALRDYQIVMWDVLTNDYAQNLAPEKSLKESIRATRPGSIVVLHDSMKAERNMMYVLPRFIDHFGSLGYSFKALP